MFEGGAWCLACFTKDLKMNAYEYATEQAHIAACERDSPNAPEFDKLEEKLLDEMLEPTCGVCPHMECDHCVVLFDNVRLN